MRVLNQDTARVLARVESGETVEITRHGRVIGRIVPAHSDALDDLIAAGKISPATVTGPWSAPTGEPLPGTEAGLLIRQLRDEELW